MLIGQIAAVVLAVILCASCKRDPNAERQHYLEKGNKYFDAGKYEEAQITYRTVCGKDLAWGPACYRLGLAYLKLGRGNDAVKALHNAIGLLPPESPDHWAAVVSISDLYLAAAPTDKQAMQEVEDNCQRLLRRDPQSFDGHRLAGDMYYAQAYVQYQGGHQKEWLKQLNAAIEEFRRADTIKPGQRNIMMQLARALAAKGDLAGAEGLFRSVIALDGSFGPAWIECFRLLMAEKKPAPGEQLLKEASQRNPKVLEYRTMLAEHYLGQGRRDEMGGVIDQIRGHAQDFERAQLATGDLYLRAGDREAAIHEYRNGAAQDPRNATAYLKRVRDVLLQQGKVKEAAEVNSQILKDNPKDSDARAMAAAFVLDREPEKATAELQAVLKDSPDNITAKLHLGQAYYKRGEVDQARKQFEETIELRPTDVVAILALAELQLTQGEFEPALQNASRSIALEGSNIEARLIAAAAFRGEKKFGEARKLLDAVLKAEPGSAKGLLQLGELNLAERKFPEAEDAFLRAYRLNAKDMRALVGIANTDVARKTPDKAIALLQQATDKAPNRVDLRLLLGGTAMRAEKYDIAIREFQMALDQTGARPGERGEAYLSMGEIYRRKGDLNGAIRVLEDGRKAEPGHVGVVSQLALVLDKSGRKTEAREAYEAALKLDPDNAAVLNNLAFLMADRGGNLDDALSKAQRARELQPNLDSALDTIGWIYLKKDIVDTAARIFGGLVEKHGGHPTYHYHFAVALARKNERAPAMRELREALRLNPADDEKQQIIRLLQSLS